MRIASRGIVGAAVGTLAGATPLWAHPGHVTEGGVWSTLTHLFASPYHVAVVAGVGVLAVAWALASRPARRAPRAAEDQLT